MSDYIIERQRPSLIFDDHLNPVDGFVVTGTLIPWNEPFEIKVTSLEVTVIQEKLDALVDQRRALEALSSPPDEE